MEPLTSHQEVSLAYDNSATKVGDNENFCNSVVEDNGSVEHEMGTDKVDSSSRELNEVQPGSKIENENGSHPATAKNAFDGFHDISEGSDSTLGSHKLPVFDISSGSLVAAVPEDFVESFDKSLPEPTQESDIIVVEGIESDVSDQKDYKNDPQQVPDELKKKEDSDISSGSSGDAVIVSVAPVVANFSVSSEAETVEPKISFRSTEAVAFSSDKDELGVDMLPQLVTDRNCTPLEVNEMRESRLSKKSSISESPDQLLVHGVESGDKQTSKNEQSREAPTSRSSLFPAGIPAPSAIAAALTAHPGKVLVPAVVDQVQAQSLAALQTLKVLPSFLFTYSVRDSVQTLLFICSCEILGAYLNH